MNALAPRPTSTPLPSRPIPFLLRYFSEHFAGALGNRITATGQAAGQIYSGLAWKIIPPCVDFLGAVLVLFTVELRMALALIGFVLLVAVLISGFGIRGRNRHRRFSRMRRS